MSMVNPDPKKYVLRKRGNNYILVDRQILRRRKYLKKHKITIEVKPLVNRSGRKKDKPKPKAFDYKFFKE